MGISQTQDRANCTKNIKDPSFYRRETFLNVFWGTFVPTLVLAPSLSAGLPLIQFQSRSRKSEEQETHKVRLPQASPYHLYSSFHTLFFWYSACSPGIWWCWPLAEQSAHGASIFTATFIWNWLWLLFRFGSGWIDLLLATIPEIAFKFKHVHL